MRRHPGRRELAIFTVGYVTYFGVRAVTEGRIDARVQERRVAAATRDACSGIAWEGAIQGVVGGSHVLEGSPTPSTSTVTGPS